MANLLPCFKIFFVFAEFPPDLIGLTGTTVENGKVDRAYRVYFVKTWKEGSDYLLTEFTL
jgi:hypothetical protein